MGESPCAMARFGVDDVVPPVNQVTEAERSLPVTAEADVVVAGGGIAGVAAAIAAARNGASVCLLEKSYGLGGLATLGNVTVHLPICDGMGRQVMGGLAEELLHLSVADLRCENSPARFRGVPACWQPAGDATARRKTRYRVDFNPAAFQLALVKLLQDEGVKLLYDTRVCAVQTRVSEGPPYEGQRQEGLPQEGQTPGLSSELVTTPAGSQTEASGAPQAISHLIVENKSGRSALACGMAIDATGDADICHLAGEQTESLDSNVLAGWFYTLSGRELKLRVLSNKYSADATPDGAVGPFFRGDGAEQVTAQVVGTQELMRQMVADLRERSPDVAVEPVMTPSIACFRMTRRLVGAFSLSEGDRHVWHDDMIGYTSDWRRRGPVYAIPWRSLCAVSTRNLMAVGRCMSANTTVWDVTRAIPACVVTGEAAGTAAALALNPGGDDLPGLPIGALQDRQTGRRVVCWIVS